MTTKRFVRGQVVEFQREPGAAWELERGAAWELGRYERAYDDWGGWHAVRDDRSCLHHVPTRRIRAAAASATVTATADAVAEAYAQGHAEGFAEGLVVGSGAEHGRDCSSCKYNYWPNRDHCRNAAVASCPGWAAWKPAMVVPDPDNVHPKRDWEP